ncbi:MCE family protein [Nocardioides daeguensis]|uniref:MCE family protein n=1 Tax=Nocardioides daeguensis TaxID=908359 RepID=A0ABP6WIG5_9ACTN|nr:MCE family protein [Nocardioides daeguensis]MBV6729049.1 MCE family protein [Nocardioides daeguensis]MCR1774947.1 MCE family protein [Nocardioides daeguensis]
MKTPLSPSRGHLAWPLRVVAALVVLGLLLLGVRALAGDPAYHARLRHAAGLEPGDDVRMAGLKIGEVSAVTADRDQVDVRFSLTGDPADLGVTEDSTVQVKLLSILGERFLSLAPGKGEALGDDSTIAVSHAVDSYSIERFWLESTPQVEALDLDRVHQAVDVLATDLAVQPDALRDALDGIAGVSAIANDREQQLDALLTSIRKVTDLVLDQTGRLDQVLADGTSVMLMVQQRKETLRALLGDAHRFVTGLTALVRASAPQLKPALRDLRTVLRTLDEHRAQLDKTLRLAGPTMRVFTNATGDGPWLGVNAPWAVVPDDLVCSITPEDCK